jgi:thiol-disulfide isomerase/thioredoxin
MWTARSRKLAYRLLSVKVADFRVPEMPKRDAPDALLLLATGCAHCPAVLEGLSQLLKQGRVGRLQAVNIVAHPEVAQEAGVRGVPWVRIGAFELEGALTPGELARWVDLAGSGEDFGSYFSHLLETGRAHKVTELLREEPHTLPQLIGLLQSEGAPMAVRIGVGVVLEELEGSELLRQVVPELVALARSAEANLRADAAHFLGLTHSGDAAPILRELLHDTHPDAREIASDALKMLPPNLG